VPPGMPGVRAGVARRLLVGRGRGRFSSKKRKKEMGEMEEIEKLVVDGVSVCGNLGFTRLQAVFRWLR